MATRIVPKKYLLTAKERKVIREFLEGEIGVREAGKRMNTNHQNIPRIVTSIFRHAASSQKIDAKSLLANY